MKLVGSHTSPYVRKARVVLAVFGPFYRGHIVSWPFNRLTLHEA